MKDRTPVSKATVACRRSRRIFAREAGVFPQPHHSADLPYGRAWYGRPERRLYGDEKMLGLCQKRQREEIRGGCLRCASPTRSRLPTIGDSFKVMTGGDRAPESGG